MKHSIQAVCRLRHTPIGPLIHYLDDFTDDLLRQGFQQGSVIKQIRIVADFSQWMHSQCITVNDISPAHIARYINFADNHVKRNPTATLRRMVLFLAQFEGVLGCKPAAPLTPIEQTILSFKHYLVNDRCLSTKTFIRYKPLITSFLQYCFADEPVELATLSAKDVVGFIQYQASQPTATQAKVASYALRTFLRYAAHHDGINPDLADAVPAVASWSMTGIPRAISPECIEALLLSCPRDTAIGRRDYAILMLLIHLGLRAGEVATLTLDNIDWAAGSIWIDGKGNQRTALPLPAAVGESLVDYLQHGRKNGQARVLFLCANAPVRGLCIQSVDSVVCAAISRAGMNLPSHGAHQFRHAFATALLKQHATYTEIGHLLRHKQVQTTRIYIKVDIDSLRSLSLPWPGGVQ